MKFSAILVSALVAVPVFGAILKPVEGNICGTVVKVGDLNDSLDSLLLRLDSGEVAKIWISGLSMSITAEVSRANLALANGLRYCARVRSADEKTYNLLRSSIEKK